MEKTVYELIEQYINETAPEGTTEDQKRKMVQKQVKFFLRT